MRSFKPLAWLVAGLICLSGTDAFAKEKVDWSEYLEPKGGSKTQLTPTSGKVTTAKVTKKKTVAKKKATKGKRSKRQARRR